MASLGPLNPTATSSIPVALSSGLIHLHSVSATVAGASEESLLQDEKVNSVAATKSSMVSFLICVFIMFLIFLD